MSQIMPTQPSSDRDQQSSLPKLHQRSQSNLAGKQNSSLDLCQIEVSTIVNHIQDTSGRQLAVQN
jgi:hypothetical protein